MNFNINTSTTREAPYYDDFDPTKDYVRVLYRGGYPVQTRELTTMQTFLQAQIAKLGSSIYKSGSIIQNATVNITEEAYSLTLMGDGSTNYPITLSESQTLATIDNLQGLVISNADKSVKAQVLTNPVSVDSTKNVGNLYIKYNTENKFTGGLIYAYPEDNPDLTTTYVNAFETSSDACLASVEDGIYFVNSFFVNVEKQTIVVSDTSHAPSSKVGFVLNEYVVTQNDDSTLFDNTRGSTNEGAPGAHRLKYTLTLTAKDITDVSDNTFYLIQTILTGKAQEVPTISPQYNTLIDTLARRTYDESGNYTLKPFSGVVSPSDSDETFKFTIGPSKAYVKGYEVEKKSPTKVLLNRGTDTKTSRNIKMSVTGPTYFNITGETGILPGFSGGNPFLAANRLQLKDTNGDVVGSCRAYAIDEVLLKGIAETRLYVYDVRFYTVLTVSENAFVTAIATGNDVQSLKTKAYVTKEDTLPTGFNAASSFAAINVSGKFRLNQVITSGAGGVASTITGVTQYSFSDVTNLTTTDGTSFTANITSGSLANENTTLFFESSRHIKTMKNNNVAMDNNYTVIQDGGATVVNSANGTFGSQGYDDQTEIPKNLRFKYLKVTGPDNRYGANYGWNASDLEISLHYPDTYKVWQINETSDNTFDTGRFTRINITSPGILPQGVILVGKESGSKAIVALSNSINQGATYLSSQSTVHQVREGTGSLSEAEVIFTKGSTFTAGERLVIESLVSGDGYNFPITYNSVTDEVGQNITGSFLLDNGQRNEYYDIGRLARKDNTPAPNKDIVVFYAYFEADATTKHYYSVDSYENCSFWNVDHRYYESIQEIRNKTTDTGVDLRNCVDFRLRVDLPNAIGDSPFNHMTRDFVNQNKILPGQNFTTDAIEFLGRTDSIVLTKEGDFMALSGIPAIDPKKPLLPEGTMDVFHLNIPPATRYPKDEIAIEKIDNRRYTMRDISDLDKRIANLETTVALTMLESQALHDNVDGRTKSGFVVDDFSLSRSSPGSAADQEHPEFNASIDTNKNVLIPPQTSGVPVEMSISSTDKVSTFFSNYLIKDFVEEAFNEQMDATGPQLINPFATWIYQGEITLTPAEDNWRIREDDYFTNLYGDLQPFEGNAAEFQNFSRITTADPGGAVTTMREWIGEPITSSETTTRGANVRGREEQTFQAQREIRTVSFDTPRVRAGTSPTTTLQGTEVIENPQDYFMRSVTVSFEAENLKPTTTHLAKFGGVEVLSDLITDENGVLKGEFTIPAQTFRAGSETFQIEDAELGTDGSYGTTTFKSTGHIDHYQTTVDVVDEVETTIDLGNQPRGSSTFIREPRPVVINNEFVTNVTNVTQNVTNITNVNRRRRRPDEDRGDPIAQMFMLPFDPTAPGFEKEKSIITSLDLWFSNVDTRTSNNRVKVEIREAVNGYPGGPDKIIGSSGFVALTSDNQTSTISKANATNFKFKEPVVLKGNTEYAIVIKSPSDQMSVYTAEIGQRTIDGSAIHSTQPNVGGYFGSFFKSQNQTTWNADQAKDLTYRLYRANFDTNNDGVIETSTITLNNTIQDSNYHKGDIGAFNRGLNLETFAGTNYVKVTHPNHGMHYSGAQVTLSGFTGKDYNGIPGSEIDGTHTIYYPTLNSYFIKVTSYGNASGKPPASIFNTFATQDIAFDSMVTNFMIRKEDNDDVAVKVDSTYTNTLDMSIAANKISYLNQITPYSNGYIDVPIDRYVEFEDPRLVRSATNANGSVDLKIQLLFDSANKYTSPYVKINSNLNPIVFRNIVGNSLVDSDIESLATREADSDDSIAQEFVSYIQGQQSEQEHSAYVTKPVELEIPAEGFTIRFDADMEPTSKVVASYKARQPGDDTPFEDLEWIDFPSAQEISEDNYGPFSSDPNLNAYTMRTTVPYEFSSYKLRLRMITQNEAQIPRLKDLRVIADI